MTRTVLISAFCSGVQFFWFSLVFVLLPCIFKSIPVLRLGYIFTLTVNVDKENIVKEALTKHEWKTESSSTLEEKRKKTEQKNKRSYVSVPSQHLSWW